MTHSVTPEEGGDRVRVAVDNLVKLVTGAREGVGAVPAGQDVTHDPRADTLVFALLQLGGKETQEAKVVRLGRVDVCYP